MPCLLGQAIGLQQARGSPISARCWDRRAKNYVVRFGDTDGLGIAWMQKNYIDPTALNAAHKWKDAFIHTYIRQRVAQASRRGSVCAAATR